MSCLTLNYLANVLTLLRIFAIGASFFLFVGASCFSIDGCKWKHGSMLAWIGFIVSVLLVIFIPSSSIVLNGCHEMPWFLKYGE